MRERAAILAMAGAVGSVALLIYAGRHSAAPLVIVLMAGWVLAPYLVLLWAERRSARWSPPVRAAFGRMALLTTVGSLAVYLRFALQPRGTKPAAAFVAVPPTSLLLAAVVVGAVALAGGRRS